MPQHIWVVAGSVVTSFMARGELCQWPLVGRGRRFSISSSQLLPTSPYMSAGSQPRTTVRCSLLTRWTNATSVSSSRARHSSSPQVSEYLVPMSCPPTGICPGGACPGCLLPCPGAGLLFSHHWDHLGPRALAASSLAVLTEARPGAWGCVGTPGAQPCSLRGLFADLDISDIDGGSRT